MESKLQIIKDIESEKFVSAYVDAPFDEGKEILERAKYKIISLEENVKLRIQEGREANISRNGNWVREGIIYVSKDLEAFLTKTSPIMTNAKEVTDLHRKDIDYYLTDNQIEEALSSAIKLRIGDTIPTNRFAEDEITVYAFGDIAKQYGDLLRESNILEAWFELAFAQMFHYGGGRTFARQVWFKPFGKWMFDGCGLLYGDDRVRGISKMAREHNKP